MTASVDQSTADQSVADRSTADHQNPGHPPQPPEPASGHLVQRLVLPLDRDLDVLALYVDTQQSPPRTTPLEDDDRPVVVVQAPGPQHPEQVLGRRSFLVPAGTRASFATYFNAFPASYWRTATAAREVRLEVATEGYGTVLVYRSTADGRVQRVASVAVDGVGVHPFTLTLEPFVDGGWYWFDAVAAGQADLKVADARWSLPATPPTAAEPGTVTIAITTFNRPESCVQLLGQLAGSAELLDLLDEVIVVDQGTRKVADTSEFATAEAGLGGRLRIIDQANLGGSGGFARGMLETLQGGRSRYVLLLDDDVSSDPESIVRAVTFADACPHPTLVGGHMFSSYARSTLHSLGEVVHPWRFWWDSAPTVTPDHDLAQSNLRQTPWLHRRVDVDYNGWWMTLIPTAVLREVGLALPLFIKWDDAEYGLRAGAAGFRTVSLPGVAVWHVPWTDKDDALDWQAYFHERNRFVAALLHSPFPRGGRLVRESLNHQIKHLLAMQYSVAELRLRALEDLLDGPERLPGDLPTKLAEVRELRAGHADARTSANLADFPPPRPRRPPRRSGQPASPDNPLAVLATAARGLARQVRQVPADAESRPERRLAAMDARWWALARLDSALVSMPDGASAAWYRRDRGQFAQLLARSVEVHRRLFAEWPQLRQRYRAAAGELVSPGSWQAVFEKGGS